MRKVSLVISDVDGTLVTHDKALTARAIAAVERLHEAGIGFSICSSRPPFGLRMLIEPLRLTLPFGGYNTGAIVEPDLSVIEQKLILPDVAKQAVSLFQQHHIDCWVFVGNEWLITNPQGDHVERETHTIQTPPTVVPAFDDSHFAAVGKIVGPSKDHTLIARLTDLMQTALDDRASVGRSQPYYCDVIPPGIDKGRLVEFLARCLDVPQPEILVLGDMENDLAMFRRAGFAIAMGNASDDVKCAAHATTPSISSTSRSGRSSRSRGETRLVTRAARGARMPPSRTRRRRRSSRRRSASTAFSPGPKGRTPERTARPSRSARARAAAPAIYHELKRPLIRPEEIMHDTREDELFVIPRGGRPLRCGRAVYFRRPEFVRRVGTNRFVKQEENTDAG